jgi:class 3 adenylate cyclase
LQAGPSTPHELRKVVTVVFCDVVGSTSMGERLDPESVQLVITRYFEATREALERHGGTVEKFIGDAVMTVFGIPAVREDDALRAVRAAADARGALARVNDELEQRWGVRLCARIGVNTGEVVVGDRSRGHGFATGDAVNVAARLQQAAEPDEILLGERTLALVRDAVRVEPLAPLAVKGKREPLRAFRLLGVAQQVEPVDRRLDAPLVGRQPELALLQASFERAVAQRSCELVSVVGSAGVGKSRLAHEFAGTLGDTARVVGGRCLSYGAGLTYWPLRQVVAELARSEDGESADETIARIARLLEGDPDAGLVAERIAGALGLAEASTHLPETTWAVRKLLEASARARPLVVVFEDVHWGELAFLDLIEQLAATIQGVAVVLVVVARPDLFDARPDFAAGTRVELEPLSGADSRALVAHLLDDADEADELAGRVVVAAEGNPLFIEELVHVLVDEPERSTVSVPPTIHAVLAARLDRLDPAERAVVEAAAVVGRCFERDALLELTGSDDPPALDRCLRALERRQLIEGGDTHATFGFKHILIRDVAYEGTLKRMRSDLHERYARWLERTTGERASEHGEILAHHLERAVQHLAELGPLDANGRDLAARAANWLGFSGRRALARGDIPPALALLERAVLLLPEDDPARRDLTLKLGIALAEAGQLTRVGGLLQDRIDAERHGREFVVFHDAGGHQRVVHLADDASTISVGRRPENDLALWWDDGVSREHAQLLRLPEGWTLVDSGSRNGSYLNGRRISERHALRDGDVLRFGDTVVLFRAPLSGDPRGAVAAPGPDQPTSVRETPRARGLDAGTGPTR